MPYAQTSLWFITRYGPRVLVSHDHIEHIFDSVWRDAINQDSINLKSTSLSIGYTVDIIFTAHLLYIIL
jgi:hypothetical protein